MISTARPLPFRLVHEPVAAVVAAAGVVVALVWWLWGWPLGLDSAVYRSGALAVLNGQDLYGRLAATPDWSPDLPFAYPPTAALVFLPLAVLPTQLVWGVMAVSTVAGLVVVVRLVRDRSPAVAYPSGFLLLLPALEPVWRTIGFGQINVLLMALVVVDVLALRGSRFCGVLVGVAAAIKLTPLIFVLHLVVTRRRGDALRALGTFAGLGCVAFVLLPGDTVRYWSGAVLGANGAMSNVWSGNQSLSGLVRRLAGPSPAATLVLALLAVTCVVVAALLARAAEDRGNSVEAMLVTAFCGLLVSPISWTHHWVWVAPLCVLMRKRFVPVVVPVVAAFSGWTFWLVPQGDHRELAWTPLESLVGNAYVLSALVAGAALAVHLVRTGRKPPLHHV
ncbi:glycosyltransferase 87 family protein [Actinosynnema sp. CS-041913]|uniref:glycosyltransferase 87 family protein n=1 Tax=Actinosynnema sp. CS-041913 TaxID=3239917 RepID=UPI003D93F561